MECSEGRFVALGHVLRVVPPPCDVEEALAPDAGAAACWSGLGDSERRRVALFLSGARERDEAYAVRTRTLPEDFARGLGCCGPALRAAFPELARRIVSVITPAHEAIVVRVACSGEHRGAFFRILSATGRRVSFEVVHCLVVREGRAVEHRVEIDVRGIVSQLANGAAPKRGSA
jgi:hypothetical protein